MNSVSSIATSGISTAQLALGVAANNIANAQTAGYARQQVVPLSQNGGGVRGSVTEAPGNPFGDYTADLLNAKSASYAVKANMVNLRPRTRCSARLLDVSA
ncbi:MAG: flagellar basal body protein [Lysobacteraceae bacterium]